MNEIHAQNIGIIGDHAHVEGGIHFHASPLTTPISATAPTPPPHFTSRRAHLDVLKTALCQGQTTALTALQGMGGIGKTATAQKLAAELDVHFPGGIFWGALPDYDGNPRPILRAWGRVCAQDLSCESDPNVLVNLVRGLLTARRAEQGPLLIIVDDVRQTWLQAIQLLDQARPPDAPLLLTTRDETLAAAIGAVVHRLDTLPLVESLALLKAHAGAAIVETDIEAAQILLETLGHLPLAIEIAGKRLALQARKPGYRLATLGRAVAQRAMKTLTLPGHSGLAATFAITYDDLPVNVQRAFRWLGVFAANLLHLTHIASVLDLDKTEAEVALDTLVLSALLAWGETKEIYTIHPLLRQYAQALLTQSNSEEEGTEESRAKQSHLTYYLAFAQANAQNDPAAHDRLDTTLPDLLAAVDWAVQTQDYHSVSAFGEALYDESQFLNVRGYAHQAMELLTRSASACRETGDRRGEGKALGNLGLASHHLGQVKQAIEYHKKALVISREIGDQLSEGIHLGNLGSAYYSLGQSGSAIESYQQAQTILRETNNLHDQGRVLNNLGLAYYSLGQVERAIELHKDALAIAHKTGDRWVEGTSLGGLGNVYRTLWQIENAIEYYKDALIIAREIGAQWMEEVNVGNLGSIYRALGQVKQAIKYYEAALAIARKIGDRRKEGAWIGNLGHIYYDLGKFEQAIQRYEAALVIAHETGDRRGKGYRLGDLGVVYRDLGQVEQATEFHQQALTIARETGERRKQGICLDNLGIAHYRLGQFEKAISYHEKALALSRKTSERRGESYCLLGLGRALLATGELSKARQCCKKSLALDVPETSYQAALTLGIILLRQGDTTAGNVFENTVVRCQDLLNQTADLYAPRYALAAALAGRAVCDRRWPEEDERTGLLAPALAEYRQALETCTALGIVSNALRNLEMISATNIESLAPILEVLKNAMSK